MNRYLLFGYDVYYPCGGATDLIGSYESEENINEYFIAEMSNKEKYFSECDCYQVLDTQTGDVRIYKLPNKTF